MHLDSKTLSDLQELLNEVKKQDETFKGMKSKLNIQTQTLEVRKAFGLYETSPQHLEYFARQGDLKGMRGMVHSRQVLINFILKKTMNLSIVNQ